MPKPLGEWIHLLRGSSDIPKSIIFRVDAGRVRGLSFGHLERCLILARAFKKLYNTKALFLMRPYKEGISYARKKKQSVMALPAKLDRAGERERVVKAVKESGSGLLIVDLPYNGLDTSYFGRLRREGVRVVFIDDSRFMSPEADVILNSSILAPNNTKRTRRKVMRYLLGPEYLIHEKPKEARALRKKKAIVEVAITFGGSDPAGFTSKVVKALAKGNWPGVKFRIILGPGYAGLKPIKKLAKSGKNLFEVIQNPAEIAPILTKSSMVICAGGRTLYELYALGVPALAIASIEHEVPVIQSFLKKRMLLSGLKAWNEGEFNKKFKACLRSIG
ncbi:MAG: hypothetical protein HQ558_04645 [Candidatus Omnitrophica bacterium]|nr:hypothetical protein [Candidatus Omnitrophota bacterium]